MSRRLPLVVVATFLITGAAACSSSGSTSDGSAASTSTTVEERAALTIVVTNDDGIKAPGIDTLVTALDKLDDVDVHVVAPAENQSGTGDKTTPGGAKSQDGTTESGIEGTAVDGYPADTVNVAVDDLHLDPDLVVSGINRGQNVGPLASISGTVGAALTAARRGIPAIAGSAGLTDDADYRGATALLIAWIDAHRAALVAGKVPTASIINFNVPQCTAGTPRPLVKVPLAAKIPDGVDPFKADCAAPSTTAPTTDVDAVAHGYQAQTVVPANTGTS